MIFLSFSSLSFLYYKACVFIYLLCIKAVTLTITFTHAFQIDIGFFSNGNSLHLAWDSLKDIVIDFRICGKTPSPYKNNNSSNAWKEK